jgi:alginate O-acetyltransferase complex protein AlgI
MHWMPAYGLLLLILTLVNYSLGLLIARSNHASDGGSTSASNSGSKSGISLRKTLLVGGLIFNLGCLCFFKYTNFLVDSLFQSAKFLTPFFGVNALNMSQSPALQIILPLGISFFTFEFIHYITDVYKGSQPIRNIRDFALFAGFFPSQIAGPIKRFQDFVQQLNKDSSFVSANFSHGLFLILQGLFKKVVLGDNLGLLVNAGYQNVQALGTTDAWVAVVAFALQLFFDFSGYTDIGRGSAFLLGYNVPENFNLPYLAASLTEFWHRWHMSLSTWLRDYLYIPLGGSRGSVWQARRNTFLTMVLGGLWHGASWNFVIWGALHGAGLVLSKDWYQLVSRFPALAKLRPHPIWHWSGVAFTVFFWTMTGIFFRANDLPSAMAMAQKLVHAGAPGAVTDLFVRSTLPFTLCLYAVFCLCRSAEHKVDTSSAPALIKNAYAWMHSSLPVKVVSYAAAAIIIIGFAPVKTVPFIYFQF